MRAYDEYYLSNARRTLANSFDYAALSLGIPLDKYFPMFIKTDLASRFEKGDPFIVSGRSGVELALMVMQKNTGRYEYRERLYLVGRSREYWVGWALAYYQWYTGLSFRKLNVAVPVTTVLEMYEKYHEMDIMQFVDRVDEMRLAARASAYLKEYRKAAGYSQNELAKITGIPVRTLQHYEQGTKSLDKANASYVLSLSRALECEPEDLLTGSGS